MLSALYVFRLSRRAGVFVDGGGSVTAANKVARAKLCQIPVAVSMGAARENKALYAASSGSLLTVDVLFFGCSNWSTDARLFYGAGTG